MKKKYFLYKSNVYIIGGRWKGRKLPIFLHEIRPTTNKMRETLFNWLSPIIKGKNCLDCFAGSGALGFEALSRHASSVTLLEINQKISINLHQIIKIFNMNDIKIFNVNSLRWLSCAQYVPYDIVFIDPPFYYGITDKIIILLEKYNILSPVSWIYIETEKIKFIRKIPDNWKLYRTKSTKTSTYELYIRYDKKM